MIKAYLVGVEKIREALEGAGCTSQLCKWVLQECGAANTTGIAALLEEAIEPDATYSKAPIDMRNNRMWAVKVSGCTCRRSAFSNLTIR